MDLSSTGDGFLAYPSICFECYTARDLGATRLVRWVPPRVWFIYGGSGSQAGIVVVDAIMRHRRFCLRIIRRMRISRNRQSRARHPTVTNQPVNQSTS